jgi:16S rRNA (cytosine1402-N4)-methyltransferase
VEVTLEFYHKSVLFDEIIDAAADIPKDGVVVDCTMGGGGHTLGLAGILEKSGTVVGVDRDPEAIQKAESVLCNVEPSFISVHGAFAEVADILLGLGIFNADFILADLGVSSRQLDEPQRGFSFKSDGPLDMRMDFTSGETLKEKLKNIERNELARIIRMYGEEKLAGPIASSIIRNREAGTLNTTSDLAKAVQAVKKIKWKDKRKGKKITDPATKTFQALRIWVNGELDQLETLLEHGPGLLKDGGVLAIISFHSLEDRLVKNRFKYLCKPELLIPDGILLTKDQMPKPDFKTYGVIKPTKEECSNNPRSRSAILRLLIKLEANS